MAVPGEHEGDPALPEGEISFHPHHARKQARPDAHRVRFRLKSQDILDHQHDDFRPIPGDDAILSVGGRDEVAVHFEKGPGRVFRQGSQPIDDALHFAVLAALQAGAGDEERRERPYWRRPIMRFLKQ